MCVISISYPLMCILGVFSTTNVPPETLLPYDLVQAEVISIELFDVAGYRASSKITHVYKGDPSLLGQVFTIESNIYGESTQGLPSFVPPLKVGDVAIWHVQRNNNSVEQVPGGVIRMKVNRVSGAVYLSILSLPVRKGNNRDVYRPYQVVEQWAKSVESVSKAPPENRYAMLKDLTLNPSRPTAKWAMAVLAEADIKDTEAFFRELIECKDLSVSQQLIVDEVLTAVDWNGWGQSPDRLRLFQKWVKNPLPEDASGLLANSLNQMVQHPPFTIQSVMDLLEHALKNRDMSLNNITMLLRAIGSSGGSSGDAIQWH